MDTQKANNEAKSKQTDAEVYQEATKILVEKYCFWIIAWNKEKIVDTA